ncbi:two-component system sensor histidine kinase DesK [Hamadaea flava]|uniref:Sensor histidine kinase n=1 Tax=Hamadaea flava TaxID=1742688 RepID=A0ABV8LUK5_9ACTN|nr:histidine kinase [Hamadaea flava]MCP2328284.1 two-component system sensor histidine kinase DesK [Hamadaea flava]
MGQAGRNALIILVVLAGVALDPLRPVPNPAFAAVVVLQLLHCLTPWRSRWTLAAQVVLLPFAGPGAAGMVAASALLVVRGAARWIVYAAAVLLAALLVPAVPFGIALAVLNAGGQGLVLFAVTRLGDTRAAVEATRAELAARTVEAERAQAAQHLESAVGTALSRIIALAAQGDLAGIAEVARSATAQARAVSLTPAQLVPEPDLPPRLALPILLAVHGGYLITGLIYLGGRPLPSVLLAVALGLHLALTIPVPRTIWPLWALGAVAAVGLVYPGRAYPQLAGFAAAGFLAAGRFWWPLAAVSVAGTAAVLAARGYDLPENVYWSFNTVAIGVMFAGLAAQTTLVLQAREARRALSALAAAGERRRISRDVHDLLGSGLSAITLQAELAKHVQSVRTELSTITSVARDSLAALRAIPADPDPRLSLAAELDTARTLLTAAGTHVDVDRTADRDDPLLAVVLREAVTNVLRHSAATRCRIEVTPDGLTIVNDGVSGSVAETGSGTANLTERVTAAGGTFHIEQTGEEYRLTVLYPAVIGRDPDRVEPIART